MAESLFTATEAQSLLDHPYVACCGDCGTRLHCALGYDPDHTGTHARVQQDVHRLARTVLALDGALTEAEADVQRRAALTQMLAEAVRDGAADALTIARDYLEGTVASSHRMLMRGAELLVGGWATRLISQELFRNLDASGAVNNCEWTLTSGGRSAVMSAQWKHGLTPSQQRDAATKRAEKAEGAAQVLRRELVHARQMSSGIADQAREAIERAEKAEAECARLLAITEGRITPPTDAEIDAHRRADGIWFVTSATWHESIRGRLKAQCYAEEHRENNSQWTWVSADRSGRPCAWPVADGQVSGV